MQGQIPDIFAVDQNLSRRHLIKPRKQIDKCALARAAGSHNGYNIASPNAKRDSIEYFLASLVFKRHVIKGYASGKSAQSLMLCVLFGLLRQNFKDPAGSSRCLLERIVDSAHAANRVVQLDERYGECNEQPCRHALAHDLGARVK